MLQQQQQQQLKKGLLDVIIDAVSNVSISESIVRQRLISVLSDGFIEPSQELVDCLLDIVKKYRKTMKPNVLDQNLLRHISTFIRQDDDLYNFLISNSTKNTSPQLITFLKSQIKKKRDELKIKQNAIKKFKKDFIRFYYENKDLFTTDRIYLIPENITTNVTEACGLLNRKIITIPEQYNEFICIVFSKRKNSYYYLIWLGINFGTSKLFSIPPEYKIFSDEAAIRIDSS
jgi:hypothetical protein